VNIFTYSILTNSKILKHQQQTRGTRLRQDARVLGPALRHLPHHSRPAGLPPISVPTGTPPLRGLLQRDQDALHGVPTPRGSGQTPPAQRPKMPAA
jgi:hypothetical protein